MKAIAFINNKGGCGKSTSLFHIAGELASRGRRVLVIDCDKQGDTTVFFLSEEESDYDDNSKSLLNLILNENTFDEVVKKNYIKQGNRKPEYMGIDVIPAAAELEDQEKYNNILKDKDLSELFDGLKYDYILIDCPPSNRMIERLVLEQWATHVLIPMSCDISSIRGVGALVNKIDNARVKNPDLKIAGIFYSMFLPFRNKHRTFHNAMLKKFPNFFIKDYIPFCSDVVESLEDEGRPLAFYRKSRANNHVKALTTEILKRL